MVALVAGHHFSDVAQGHVGDLVVHMTMKQNVIMRSNLVIDFISLLLERMEEFRQTNEL